MYYHWHFVVWLLILSTTALADERTTVAEGPVLPIWAWMGVPADHATSERYQELAACGFTHSFSPAPDAKAMREMLDAGHEHGIKQLISIPMLKDEPEATAREFKEHPAIGGYYLRDEPGAGLFPMLGAWTRRIQSVDDEHPCYVNLLPTYGNPAMWETPDYETYVSRYLAEVPTPMLSFDHYPVVRTGADASTDRLRDDFYHNLEVCSAAARKADRPLGAFALSVAHSPYPIPTTPHLRIQVYSNLAYGAQVIQYFTYWTVESSIWNFHQAPIEKDGSRTPTYDRVKQMNDEIQAIRAVFVDSTVEAVAHTGETIPTGTKRYAPTAPIKSLETKGTGAVVSQLSKGNEKFLVVVNRDIHQAMELAIELDGSRRVRRVAKDGTLDASQAESYQDEIPPGDVVIFAWE